MALSKPGLASLILGIVLLAGTVIFGFAGASAVMIVVSTILGGLVLFSLFLILIGLLMLIV